MTVTKRWTLIMMAIAAMPSSVFAQRTIPPEEVDIFACYSALYKADGDKDGKVNRAEYLDFVVDFGQTECLGDLDSLSLLLSSAFNEIACLCETRGRGVDCCLKDAAHVETFGAGPGDMPNAQVEEYLASACVITDRAIMAECPPVNVPSEDLPENRTGDRRIDPFAGAAAEEDDGLSDGALAGLIIGILALLCLCCLLCLVCCCRRRRRRKRIEDKELEEEEEELRVTEEEEQVEEQLGYLVEEEEEIRVEDMKRDIEQPADDDDDGDRGKLDDDDLSDQEEPTGRGDGDGDDDRDLELGDRDKDEGDDSAMPDIDDDDDDNDDGRDKGDDGDGDKGDKDDDDDDGKGYSRAIPEKGDDDDDDGRRFKGFGVLPGDDDDDGAFRLRPTPLREPDEESEELEIRHVEFIEPEFKDDDDWKPDHDEIDAGVYFPERQPWEGGYEADGGVYLPERPEKEPVEWQPKPYQRQVKPEPEDIDMRKKRMLKGLGDGEVWGDLAAPPPRASSDGLSDALDWVIRSALNAHETARDQGKLTDP